MFHLNCGLMMMQEQYGPAKVCFVIVLLDGIHWSATVFYCRVLEFRYSLPPSYSRITLCCFSRFARAQLAISLLFLCAKTQNISFFCGVD